jgi:hypothetical protein
MGRAIWNRDGTLSRQYKTPCKQCGATQACDECWEHECNWSPFGVWHCLLCRMPQASFDGGMAPHRCEFCGWDEATETTRITFGR